MGKNTCMLNYSMLRQQSRRSLTFTPDYMLLFSQLMLEASLYSSHLNVKWYYHIHINFYSAWNPAFNRFLPSYITP